MRCAETGSASGGRRSCRSAPRRRALRRRKSNRADSSDCAARRGGSDATGRTRRAVKEKWPLHIFKWLASTRFDSLAALEWRLGKRLPAALRAARLSSSICATPIHFTPIHFITEAPSGPAACAVSMCPWAHRSDGASGPVARRASGQAIQIIGLQVSPYTLIQKPEPHTEKTTQYYTAFAFSSATLTLLNITLRALDYTTHFEPMILLRSTRMRAGRERSHFLITALVIQCFFVCWLLIGYKNLIFKTKIKIV